MDNACMNCKRRRINCHSSCKDYKEFKSQLEEIKAKKKESYIYMGHLVDTLERFRR